MSQSATCSVLAYGIVYYGFLSYIVVDYGMPWYIMHITVKLGTLPKSVPKQVSRGNHQQRVCLLSICCVHP